MLVLVLKLSSCFSGALHASLGRLGACYQTTTLKYGCLIACPTKSTQLQALGLKLYLYILYFISVACRSEHRFRLYQSEWTMCKILDTLWYFLLSGWISTFAFWDKSRYSSMHNHVMNAIKLLMSTSAAFVISCYYCHLLFVSFFVPILFGEYIVIVTSSA